MIGPNHAGSRSPADRPMISSCRPAAVGSHRANGRESPATQRMSLQAVVTELKELLCLSPDLTEMEAAEILGLLRSIEFTLMARQIQGLIPLVHPVEGGEPTDKWLTADEVAVRLKRSRAWVYRRAQWWAFAKRPSRKVLLISERGLTCWLERR